MTAYVLVIAATVIAAPAWVFAQRPFARLVLGAAVALLTALAALATAFEESLVGDQHRVLVLFALVLAVCGGAVVTTAAFEIIDTVDQRRLDSAYQRDPDPVDRPADDSMRAAGEVLRGGAWIGALERLAVFGTLAARWPEGVAVALAVKGLGRYPELRSGNNAGATERFIIGTLISMAWAALCIYLAFAPYVVEAR